MSLTKFLCVSTVASLILVSGATADDGVGRSSVQQFGANCNGQHDDTNAFKAAVAGTAAGGIVRVPEGNCILTDTIVIAKPITLQGVGSGSQIFGRNGKTLFQLVGVTNAVVRDLYLGSSS